MRNILHHTKKYDGSVHYRFPAKVAHQSENSIILYRGPDVDLESHRGPMVSQRRLLLFFYKDRYHNVAITWDRDWTPQMHYVNIATPAVWDYAEVTAVDLDLDIIRLHGSDGAFVDDEDEFEHHIDLFNYPRELVKACRDELIRLHSAVDARKGLFSDTIFEWRPGQEFAGELLTPA